MEPPAAPGERIRSDALGARAEAVIPGGMWGHQHNRFLTSDHPMFIESSSGPHFTDVDGRRFIDLMCAWGPMLLGYGNPTVAEATVGLP